MAKIHVLSGDGSAYNLVVHTTMPTGNNTVGNSWKACYLADSSRVSTLVAGAGLGQILATEATDVSAGNIIELTMSIPGKPDGSSYTLAQLDAFVDFKVNQELSNLQVKYKFFGFTRA